MKGFFIPIIALSLATAVYPEVIYDEQAFNYDYVVGGAGIDGGDNRESADDFSPEDAVTVQEVVIWLSAQDADLRCDFFEGSDDGPGEDPPADFFSEEVSSSDITWEPTGYYAFGYPIIKCTIPINGCELSDGDSYWLGFHAITGTNVFWWNFDYGMMGGPYWVEVYYYYYGSWSPGHVVFGSARENFYELWGLAGPADEEDPTITDTYPHDDDYPSGIPPTDNTAGCHWQDGDPEANEGIDVEASAFKVYDSDYEIVAGMLDIDDSDLWDVIVDFEADDPWEEGATYTVETETYDLAGNGPVTEDWSFTTGYANITPKSLGVIKAGYID